MCPPPMDTNIEQKVIRETNTKADFATTMTMGMERVYPCYYWNWKRCERVAFFHRNANRNVMHVCGDCFYILGQRNLHQRTKWPCPFMSIYVDTFENPIPK